jgi:hypothetical protein
MLNRDKPWRALRVVVSNRRSHQVTDSESTSILVASVVELRSFCVIDDEACYSLTSSIRTGLKGRQTIRFSRSHRFEIFDRGRERSLPIFSNEGPTLMERQLRRVGADEDGTLARLKAVRSIVVDPMIAEYRGRIVNTTVTAF